MKLKKVFDVSAVLVTVFILRNFTRFSPKNLVFVCLFFWTKRCSFDLTWRLQLQDTLLAFALNNWSRTGRLRNDNGKGNEDVTNLHIYWSKRIISARSTRNARAFFILIHLFTVLCETTTRNCQIWSPVEDFSAWHLNFAFLEIFSVSQILLCSQRLLLIPYLKLFLH